MGNKMKTALMVGVLSFFISACSLIDNSSTESRLASSCTVYAATLQTLSDMRENDKLDDKQVKNVNRVRAIVNPVCASPPENVEEALSVVSTGLSNLAEIEEEAKND